MAHARYKQVVDRLAQDIRQGRLPPGARLPTHRELAATEGIALVTATRVYAELDAMGLARGETGRGTFVREPSLPHGPGADQQAVAAGMADLNFNAPALPGQGELLRAALRRLAAAGDIDSLLRYQPHAGRPLDRETVARHLARHGLPVPADRVAIVGGAQHGLATAVMALLQPGDVVAVDALTYPGFKALAEAHRLELAPVAAGGDGPDPEAIEALCRRRRVRAVYTMPTVHNPLGWVGGARWREALAAVARRHGLFLIEDAAYAFLAADPPPPLAALVPESTVHVSSLSKSVATGLRFGFVAAPAAWMPRIERAIRATSWNTPGVVTSIACAWMEDGTVARLEERKRQDAAARQAIAAEAFAGMRTVRHPAAGFLWLPLDDGIRADRVAAALRSEGIAVSTADPFATGRRIPQALRLALGSVAQADLRGTLERVRQAVEAQLP
ncbi:MAG: PLP-dependent aminotransferase family protein [Xylophilus ampelinus]